MVTVCAWCSAVLKGSPAEVAAAEIEGRLSHGVCEGCLDQLMAEMLVELPAEPMAR